MANIEDIFDRLEDLQCANPDLTPSDRVIRIQELGNCLPKSYVPGLELKLYTVLKDYMHSKNYDLQKCALNLLYSNLQNLNLSKLHRGLSINLACGLISICNNSNDDDDTPEYQELWLKAFGSLQMMTALFPILFKNHRISFLSVLQKALTVPYTTTAQKLEVCKMLDVYVSSVDIQSVKEIMYYITSEQLIPLVFSDNCSGELHSITLQLIYRLLPCSKEVLIKYPEEWEDIIANIRDKYVPEIERLIAENDCKFAKLCILLIKLIGSTFHKGSPVVNSLLSCIEVGLRMPNLEVRRQSFKCWELAKQTLKDPIRAEPDVSQLKNIKETFEDVIVIDSSSESDTENSEHPTVEDPNNLPITLEIANKNKRKSESVSPPLVNIEAKKVKENESTETTKIDTNKLSSDDQDAPIPDDNSLINLEANTELNKLE